jgi:outer membrane protein assembly factor BamB
VKKGVAGYLLNFDRAVDVRTGKLIRPRTIIQSLFPFVVDDTMFLNDYTGVVAITLRDFAELWQYHSPVVDGKPLNVVGDPVALGGAMYAILGDATLRALDLQTGSEIGRWQSKEVVDRVSY